MKNKFAAFFAVVAVLDAGFLAFSGAFVGAGVIAICAVFLAWAATIDV